MKQFGTIMTALLLTACGSERVTSPTNTPPLRSEASATAPVPAPPSTASAPSPAATPISSENSPPVEPLPTAKDPALAVIPSSPPVDLSALLTGVAASERIAVLIRAARQALAEQRPLDGVLAARQATTEPGATAREQVLLARCLFEAGRKAEANTELKAAESGLDAVNDPSLFEDFLRLESQLLAAFGNVRELARGLEAQAARLTTNNRLTASASRILHGYRVRVMTTETTPYQLIALWSDREDLAVVTLPGAEKPILGTGSADLLWDGEPPAGTFLLFAVNPAVSLAPKLARQLKTLPVDMASDEAERRPWRNFIEALRANPPLGAAVITLPPSGP